MSKSSFSPFQAIFFDLSRLRIYACVNMRIFVALSIVNFP